MKTSTLVLLVALYVVFVAPSKPAATPLIFRRTYRGR